MYRVKVAFTDLEDGFLKYKVGDVYPREGYTPSPERIASLASDKNKLGEILIEDESKTEEPVKKKRKTQ